MHCTCPACNPEGWREKPPSYLEETLERAEARLKADLAEKVKRDTEGMMLGRDPWVHRSQGMRCRTCMYYVKKVDAEKEWQDITGEKGRCRRHAPTMGGFPVVFPTDWCGDHKLG